ncbi:MAG: cobalamin biosynthesis protein P47K [Gemmatimonadetes bacterium]|nr:cobalamin biosynthesis protein P47K [Gemmatimonadota bacterium]|tara:strand:+ start:226 stop:1251 length:1026 start_codon:yes stop_codon:yes gene_type:complete
MDDLRDIPTNLFTGLLGVGKTTAILDLIQRKSASEKWAVLVNEFGDVPIDQAVFEDAGDDTISIKEVAGGCLCCTAGVPLQVALTLLLRQTRPDRLLIEMSGMGHPGFVLRSLWEGRFENVVDLKATLCLVDPRDFEDAEIRESQTFQDQIHLADVFVTTKTDLCDSDLVTECVNWARSLFPPKRLVVQTERGRLDAAWLDLESHADQAPLFHPAHDEARGHHHEPEADLEIAIGRPHRAENDGFDHRACGWIFDQAESFDEELLLECLSEDDDIVRIKGVFRTGGEWILLNRAGEEIETRPTAYCRDSRVEVITRERHPDWARLEQRLLECRRPQPVASG